MGKPQSEHKTVSCSKILDIINIRYKLFRHLSERLLQFTYRFLHILIDPITWDIEKTADYKNHIHFNLQCWQHSLTTELRKAFWWMAKHLQSINIIFQFSVCSVKLPRRLTGWTFILYDIIVKSLAVTLCLSGYRCGLFFVELICVHTKTCLILYWPCNNEKYWILKSEYHRWNDLIPINCS